MKEASGSSELMHIIGASKMLEVCRHLGGLRLYVPQSAMPEQRNDHIRAEFATHENVGMRRMVLYVSLAEKHHLSVSRIRQIIAQKE